ncbi:ribonuclease H-like domain-containing protein [Tanacetum coccineum]
MVPRAVLMKSGLASINAARQYNSKTTVSVNTARQVNTAHSKTTVNAGRPMSYLSKIAHSNVKRPINNNITFKNRNINQRVNTVRGKNVNIARPKAVVNVVQGNNVNASACWILQDKGVIDSGCLRHMTGNMYYLTDYKEIDGGYVAFGGNPKGGKITGKCTIKTGKFDGKADECFFVGYSLNSKAFRVFNSRTWIVEENLHIWFSENTPNVVGSGPDWLFDIDALTRTMNYEQIIASTQSNGFAGTKASNNAGQARKETEHVKDYILLPLWTADLPFSQDPKSSHDDGSKPSSDDGKKVDEDPRKDSKCNNQEKEDNVNNTNNVNAASTNKVNVVGGKTSIKLLDDPNMLALEDISIFDFTRNDEDDGVEADMNNLNTTTPKYKENFSVQDYVEDNNAFGLTKKGLAIAFDKLMPEKINDFCEELTFILGLQVQQKEEAYLKSRVNMLLKSKEIWVYRSQD